MTATADDVQTVRGRPRSEACRAAILRAAAELLDSEGLRRMTMDGLAQRAGVSKATIYKWWPNKAAVALDGFLEVSVAAIPAPSGATAVEALRRHLRAALAFYSGPKGDIYRQFVAEAQSDPAFAEAFYQRFQIKRRQAVLAIWERGVAAGEFRRDVDTRVALDQIYGPIIFRLLIGPPLTPDMADALVDAAVYGLAATDRAKGLY